MTRIRTATISLLLLIILSTAVALLCFGRQNITWGAVAFIGWVVSPYALILFMLAWKPNRHRRAYDVAGLVTTLTLVVFSLFVYAEALLFPRSSTSPLVFAAAPCWMLAGGPMMFLIIDCIARRWDVEPYDEEGHLRCAGCGYDLTGNVSGICPECGRACDNLKSPR